ncbi:MAG: nitroreductase family protein [Sphingomonadales bacterium]|nr:nitroreductase family protein [Sphingomonadales bacterium]
MSNGYKPYGDYDPIPLPHRFDYADDEALSRVQDLRAYMEQRHSCRFFSDQPVPREIIENALMAGGTAPSGANHQPWHFAVIGQGSPLRAKIREGAEAEERDFYAGRASDEWLNALAPLGTDTEKPFLETAPWLIVVFAQRYGMTETGEKYKNYYVPESVGIATGMLITALHWAGLSTLTHTPSPMKFLNELCERPEWEKPEMILVVGHASDDATIPAKSTEKKTLGQLASFL